MIGSFMAAFVEIYGEHASMRAHHRGVAAPSRHQPVVKTRWMPARRMAARARVDVCPP
jgi:hypothetical protein